MKRPAAAIDQVEEEINWGNNSVAEIEGVQHTALLNLSFLFLVRDQPKEVNTRR